LSTYLAAISFAKDSLNAAWEIAKALRAAETQIKTAELKLQLAEMMNALAEAKGNLADVHEQLLENAREIDGLNEALRNKDDVGKQSDAYYELDGTSKPTGDPYCMRCWEADHRLHHLAMRRGTGHVCQVCKAVYDPHRTPHIAGGS
jgi:light-regulated signal transduction histidine kinase (bacteriophytochrome)